MNLLHRWLKLGGAALSLAAAASQAADTAPKPFQLMTLDPGHFHASLVQKFMYDDVDSRVHIYAPPGGDVAEHLKRVERFNARAEAPTHWLTETYTGSDYFEKMLADKPGNLVVIAGNNARKTDYILRSVQAGLHVLGDKPMVRTPADLVKLQQAFTVAKDKHVLLYDIMTERYEITSVLQRLLAQQKPLFGELQQGSAQDPAIVEESVHYFSKVVAGAPLIRPQWFFDVKQEGEGIVDVTTHLVDLVQSQAFPDTAFQPTDAKVLAARRWSTSLTPAQFKQVTGAGSFPAYLANDVRDGQLHVYSNGEFTYRLKGVHARVAATWAYEAPPGSGDTHHSVMRGTRSSLTIRQGETEKFKPVLYVERAAGIDTAAHETALKAAIAALQSSYPGVGMRRASGAEVRWAVTVPEKYDVGHEAHFAAVMDHFLRYLRAGKLPDWEVPNMLTKYATIMQAYELSHQAR
jgi:predicted dehydrogenase